MKEVVKTIVPSWSSVSDDDIIISPLSGGITNIIYLLRKYSNNTSSNTVMNPNNVIIRIYGDGTEMVIDRNIENVVFASLSSLRIGIILLLLLVLLIFIIIIIRTSILWTI